MTRRSSSSPALRVLGSAGWLLIATAGVGCADHAPHFIDLGDGAYLRGEQVVTVDASARLRSRQALRTELFLDGQRVAADELAPFELRWDTRGFPDGDYQLLARVELDDNGRLDDAVTIHIDNTPPTLGDVPRVAAHGQLVAIPATDNFEVARVEVSRGVAGEAAKVLVAPPFNFRWPWSCEAVTLQVRVIDRAGGETTGSFPITSLENLADQDCDQHLARSAGGDDCNDADPTIFGGALEYFDGVDRNCDGIAGPGPEIDADHDGVPSFASGGADCNDAVPAIHGDFLVLAHRELVVDGKPLTWNPGEADIVGDGSAWELVLNKDGIVKSVRPGAPGELEIETIATGANPGSVFAVLPGSTFVAFGRGNQVVIMRRAGSWVDYSVIQADAPVGGVAFTPRYLGAEYAAFQAGTKVYFASRTTDGPWTTQLLVDAAAPLVGAPFLSAAPVGATVVFRTTSTAWKADRFGTTVPLTTRTFGPPAPAVLTAMSAYTNIVSVVAADQGTGSVLYDDNSSAPVMRFPRRITGVFVSFPYVFVNLEGLGTQVLYSPDHYRRVQLLPDAGPFTAATRTAFAGSGHIDYATSGSVFAPGDTRGDQIDVDCNSTDD